MKFMIVVGHIMLGIDKVVGPFDSEGDAQAFGHGDDVAGDRYESWGTIALTSPQDEEDDDERSEE